MTALRVTFSLLSLAAGVTVWAGAYAAPQLSQHLLRSASTITVEDNLLPVTLPAGARIDVHGNLIQNAVGDYRIDPRGYPYEAHSPSTAVTQLDAPGT
jgi:hypothetical protein